MSLRAAVIVGAGSTSFEIIRQISERLPVHTIPAWMDSRVQPIAVVDVLDAIIGALQGHPTSRSYDIGGPDRLPYAQLLSRYADIAHLSRPQVGIPGLPTELVGILAGADWAGGQGGGIASALAGFGAVTTAVTSSLASAVRDTLGSSSQPSPPSSPPSSRPAKSPT